MQIACVCYARSWFETATDRIGFTYRTWLSLTVIFLAGTPLWVGQNGSVQQKQLNHEEESGNSA
jgi:hypothetical protein